MTTPAGKPEPDDPTSRYHQEILFLAYLNAIQSIMALQEKRAAELEERRKQTNFWAVVAATITTLAALTEVLTFLGQSIKH